MATIGQTLGDARRDQGLSIDDVAHGTRIHSNMIQCIEDDDFSPFPSVAYAKSFVRKYSEFLSVDVSSGLQALNSGVSVRLADNELMGEIKKTIKKDRRFRFEGLSRGARRRLKKPMGAPILLNLVLLVLIGAMGVFYFLGYDTSSPEEAKAEITNGLKKATPFIDPDPELAKDALPPHPMLVAKPIPESELMSPAEQASPAEETMEAREEAQPVESRIDRPHVKLELEEQPVSIVGDGRQSREKLKPRLTPGLPLETNISASPLESAKLEQLNEEQDETALPLSPADLDPGVSPVAPAVSPDTNPAQAVRPDRKPAKPAPESMRAVPVAANE